MRDIWIRKSWLKLATGLIALAILAAIWINYRWGLERDVVPTPATKEGASERHPVSMPAAHTAHRIRVAAFIERERPGR